MYRNWENTVWNFFPDPLIKFVERVSERNMSNEFFWSSKRRFSLWIHPVLSSMFLGLLDPHQQVKKPWFLGTSLLLFICEEWCTNVHVPSNMSKHKNQEKNNYFLLASWRSLTIRAGSGSGSVSQKFGSEGPNPHPDPYENLSWVRNTASSYRTYIPIVFWLDKYRMVVGVSVLVNWFFWHKRFSYSISEISPVTATCTLTGGVSTPTSLGPCRPHLRTMSR